ncbi:dTDP-4-dehydrorhamnose 3,5-epimerase [Paenibacillus sp. J2TS4]|uniref:dTDP-4-dehydrorhamnose 3,5-epimerase n=1 Tax=Paenibacillus sp. J2TS4 TaxID=2807194 RepID=UPI001B193AE4|nr:dTDP-4-dehydrorhamnose 3,5-epimerase [Paenibacillus sp. J2TS4]GIP35114.1 dTDP-4-dehydrorhamnose 3,5-epimerase [Paenibacillus sp. J2TS4]
MNIIKTKFEGVLIIEPKVFSDERGFFMESYNEINMEKNGLAINFVQDNHSFSSKVGVIRGLHYQLNPKAQSKLIRVTAGAIYDVVVDIRKGSVTFGDWLAIVLSADNKRQLFIPRGFAHGFCTLTPIAEVQYKVDEYYAPDLDRGIIWNDPDLGITWPTKSPILSVKDQKHPLFKNAQINFD